jgi:hypothetical protein
MVFHFQSATDSDPREMEWKPRSTFGNQIATNRVADSNALSFYSGEYASKPTSSGDSKKILVLEESRARVARAPYWRALDDGILASSGQADN